MTTIKYYGPPGTGKTATVISHFEEVVKESGPQSVLFATFTKAARKEAMSRVMYAEKELPYVRTIHSLCYRLSHIQAGELVTDSQLRQLGYRIGERISGLDVSADRLGLTKADLVLSRLHYCRQRCIGFNLDDLPPSINFFYADWLIEAYRDWKKAERLVDYTDLLEIYLERGEQPSVGVSIIDEAQDLSPLQWKVVDKLTRSSGLLVLAGDDDQAIFSWAGAEASEFINRKADNEVVLDKSYRITRQVHKIADSIIRSVDGRRDKTYAPRDEEGMVMYNAVLDGIRDVDGTCLVLFRNHYRGEELAIQLTELGVEFTGDYSKHEHGKIELLSIHQAKGREADVVFLDPEVSRKTWDAQYLSPDDEARVWYVAVTRARKELHILAPFRDYYRL